jgi:hypothetical protein
MHRGAAIAVRIRVFPLATERGAIAEIIGWADVAEIAYQPKPPQTEAGFAGGGGVVAGRAGTR